MVLFLTTTLGISIVGMMTLLGVKRYELSTGRMAFRSIRPFFAGAFHHVVVFFEHFLPALVYVQVRKVVMRAASFVQRIIAHAILVAEYWLEQALNTLRMTTHIPHPSVPASAFLREVAAHKKSLLKRSPARLSVSAPLQVPQPVPVQQERLIVHE
ncbi:hypothetical protein KW798_01500 [Candidatus Parcubacteria bacterium]|nr:hypothetical protein [Candidatus Parcubacteria bacterium]